MKFLLTLKYKGKTFSYDNLNSAKIKGEAIFQSEISRIIGIFDKRLWMICPEGSKGMTGPEGYIREE